MTFQPSAQEIADLKRDAAATWPPALSALMQVSERLLQLLSVDHHLLHSIQHASEVHVEVTGQEGRPGDN